MLAYNIWRYMKLLAQKSVSAASKKLGVMKGIVANTVRIARLKLLFIAAKVVQDGNRDKIKYSVHDARTPEMLSFLRFLDNRRGQAKPWLAQAAGRSVLPCRCRQEFSCTIKKQRKFIMLKTTLGCWMSRDSPG